MDNDDIQLINNFIKSIDIKSIEAFNKGWSVDQKYIIKDQQHDTYLLRVSTIDRINQMQKQINLVEQCTALGLPVQRLIEHGVFNDTCFILYEWIDGQEAADYIGDTEPEEQYRLGHDAGRILKEIHSIPYHSDSSWADYYNDKIDCKIKMYNECPLKYDDEGLALRTIEENRRYVTNSKFVYHHGDYHIGNMVVDNEKRLFIIDFDRADFGEGYEEFNRITWCVSVSPLFASGMINGYFNNEVPDIFWRLLKLYIVTNALSSLPWAMPYGEQQIDVMRNEYAVQRKYYKDFQLTIPTWYTLNKVS